MRKIAWSVIVLLLIAAGALNYWYNLPSSPVPNAIPVAPVSTPVEPAQAPAVQSEVSSPVLQPAAKASEQPVRKEIVPITLDKEKSAVENKNETNYDEYQYSQQKHENLGFQLAPGVTVKSGAIHIKQDENNDQSVDIERNPKNSNNEYEVKWKKKF